MAAAAYLGTSEFAATVLAALAAAGRPPELVVCPPDRPRGRGRHSGAPAVAEAAGELGLPVHRTAAVSAPESVAVLRERGIELGLVCAFGQLIKEPLLSEVEMLNVHPSPLPRWRGAAPIERAIMAGDAETAVCVMRLDEGLDSGPVALRESTPIGPAESFGDLAPRLAAIGGRLLVRALELREADELEFRPQPDEGITYAEKIGPRDRRLDPALPAAALAARVRALTPHIGAWLALADGGRLGVRAARAEPGAIALGATDAHPEGFALGCAEDALVVLRVQPAGGREMAAPDYLRGHELPVLA